MLTHKKKAKIAKRLAAIYYVAYRWPGEDWGEVLNCITDHVSEIAYDIGGQRMMNMIPVLVEELRKRCENEHTDTE